MAKKILIIEDNYDIRENTAEILELANYKVHTAPDGKEGVRVAKEEQPDIIICDIMMPELDGYGVLHILSRDPITADIPFIFLTAKVEKEDFRKGMNLGADDYLTKPFEETDLLDAIESRIKRHQAFNSNKTPQGSLDKLLEQAKVKKFKKKETVYQEGDYPNYLYYIASGKIKIYLLNEDGKELITGLYGKGDFIGYTALLENKNHNEIAATLEETEIKLIPRYDFLELISHQNDTTKDLLKLIADELGDKEQQLINLAYDTVRKRVADALIQLETKYNEAKEDVFTISISRHDLASMVGTATESVIRILSEFKEDKLITVQGSKISITNLKGLEAIMY